MKFLTFLVQRKELFTLVFVGSLVLGYVGIYAVVEERFEASATIVPKASEDLGGLSSVLRGMKGLPLGLGSQSVGSETDLYTTVLESRTLLEKVVRRFNLTEVYEIDTTTFGYMEVAIKRLEGNVKTSQTAEEAYVISVQSNTRERAAEMANFMVEEMNAMIISLKVSESRENRIFLENRVKEIRTQLAASEDSLRACQERTGLLEAKGQIEGILKVHTELEAELAARELQRGILERQYDRASPQVREVEVQIQEYRKKMADLRANGNPGGPLIGLQRLPKTAVEYLRWYREIEINQLLLEFIIPMYEQAKIEEKKDYPILQVIDQAQPPRRRVWPPRVLLALVGAFSVLIIVVAVLYGRAHAALGKDSEFWRLAAQLRTWSWRLHKE